MKKSFALGLIILLLVSLTGCGGGGSTAKYTLTIDITGQGTVTPPSGQEYSKDTVVTLTPTRIPAGFLSAGMVRTVEKWPIIRL